MCARRLIASLAGLSLFLVGCTEKPSLSAPQAPPANYGKGEGQAQAQGFTLVATGDVLIHPALTDQAREDGKGDRDYRPLFAGVKPVVDGADLALCHLEVPLAKAPPFTGYPAFNSPPEVATALRDTGYDACSTASNHTIDKGAAGVASTLDVLDSAGIKHTGSARSRKEAQTPLVLDANGVKVGHVSFSFGFNGIELPAGKPWLANTMSADAVLTAAREAREAGAEVVVASLHWGTEYRHEPTTEQTKLARKILEDPAVDLIIGHHAHVVQPFEKIGDKWVAYGLGNHVAKHAEPKGITEEGAIARFRFTKGGSGWVVDRAEYLPTLVDLGPPIRLRDLTTTDGADGVDAARRHQALTRTDGIVLGRGAGGHGLSRPGR